MMAGAAAQRGSAPAPHPWHAAEVGEGARLENVILWPDAKIESGVALRNAVVTPKDVCQCDEEGEPLTP